MSCASLSEHPHALNIKRKYATLGSSFSQAPSRFAFARRPLHMPLQTFILTNVAGSANQTHLQADVTEGIEINKSLRQTSTMRNVPFAH
jgi:hypothetical protein